MNRIIGETNDRVHGINLMCVNNIIYRDINENETKIGAEAKTKNTNQKKKRLKTHLIGITVDQ